MNRNIQAVSDTANSGVAFGVAFGSQTVKDKGQWQVKYLYRKLEKDAWLDFLPDNDTYGSGTNVRGSEIIIQYGLTKNVSLGLDYYLTNNISGKINSEQLLQTDIQFKF
jgi:hypothetical protein